MAQLVAAPVRKARSGGIKDVVDFIEEPRLGGPAGEEIVWDSLGCTFPTATRATCFTALVAGEPAQAKKVGVEPGRGVIVIGPFALYDGVECWLGGDNEGESYQAQAEALLAAGEDRPLEEKVWAWASGAAADPIEAASLVAAIGAADSHADENYLGQPVLILSRTNATIAAAAGAVKREDGKLVTATGNPVLATSSAPDDEVAVVGALAVYVTPAVARQAHDLGTNKSFAIAERVYAVGVDCDYRHVVTIATPAP